MHSEELPPLRAASIPRSRSSVPYTPSSAVADYTYKARPKTYTTAVLACPPNTAPPADETVPALSSSPHSHDDAAAVAGAPGCATAPTAGRLQAKLQRALWLDQRTTVAHAETTARGALRCAEADARSGLWCAHRQRLDTQLASEAYARRIDELDRSSDAQRQGTWRQRTAWLVEQEEPEARQSILAEAALAFQLLRMAEGTAVLRLSSQAAQASYQSAVYLEMTAEGVRAWELEIAQRACRRIAPFCPLTSDLDLLLATADGGVGRRPSGEESHQLDGQDMGEQGGGAVLVDAAVPDAGQSPERAAELVPLSPGIASAGAQTTAEEEGVGGRPSTPPSPLMPRDREGQRATSADGEGVDSLTARSGQHTAGTLDDQQPVLELRQCGDEAVAARTSNTSLSEAQTTYDHVGEATEAYRRAFDRAAAIVYAEQYAVVEGRHRACNAALMHATQVLVHELLEARSIVMEEEAAAWCGVADAQCVWARGVLARRVVCEEEEKERREVEAAQVRAANLLMGCCGMEWEVLHMLIAH